MSPTRCVLASAFLWCLRSQVSFHLLLLCLFVCFFCVSRPCVWQLLSSTHVTNTYLLQQQQALQAQQALQGPAVEEDGARTPKLMQDGCALSPSICYPRLFFQVFDARVSFLVVLLGACSVAPRSVPLRPTPLHRDSTWAIVICFGARSTTANGSSLPRRCFYRSRSLSICVDVCLCPCPQLSLI